MQDEFVMFAQKAFIVFDGKLLIIQKSKNCTYNALKWEVPGGRKQIGENLDDHIKREVLEEVGLEIVPKNVFDMSKFEIPDSVNPVSKTPITVVAVARICSLNSNAETKITEDVIGRCEWVDINEDLLKYDFMQGIKPVMENFVKNYKK